MKFKYHISKKNTIESLNFYKLFQLIIYKKWFRDKIISNVIIYNKKMVNLSTIDKDVYKSLGFKNKSVGITLIKEVLKTKVTQYKTVPALVQHIKPKINNLITLGFDVNDKKIYKQLKSIKKIAKQLEKTKNTNVEKIFEKWEEEFKINNGMYQETLKSKKYIHYQKNSKD